MFEIIVFIIPFVFVSYITWLKINEKQKHYRMQVELFLKALEAGQALPTGWIVDIPKPKKNNQLNIGIICMTAGIGIALFAWILAIMYTQFYSIYEDNRILMQAKMIQAFAVLGIIPFFIGIAYMIIHFIEKKSVIIKDAE